MSKTGGFWASNCISKLDMMDAQPSEIDSALSICESVPDWYVKHYVDRAQAATRTNGHCYEPVCKYNFWMSPTGIIP